MSTFLIATIVVLSLLLLVLGYLWLFPRKKSENFRVYQEISRAAARSPRANPNYRSSYRSRSSPDWR
jgi:hypothetical protein